MEWQMMPIEEYFKNAIKARRLSDETCEGADYCDQEANTFILLRDYDKTLSFLQSADEDVIACAIDSLEDLVLALSKKEALEIVMVFEKKLEEFPNVLQLSASDYHEELSLAKKLIADKE